MNNIGNFEYEGLIMKLTENNQEQMNMIQGIKDGDWSKVISLLKLSEDKSNSFKFEEIYQ